MNTLNGWMLVKSLGFKILDPQILDGNLCTKQKIYCYVGPGNCGSLRSAIHNACFERIRRSPVGDIFG